MLGVSANKKGKAVMFSVNTNNNAMAALQSLRDTNAQMSATQNAVSTGKKVNSASDDPAIYAISQTMNADIAGLSAVSDGLAFGQSVLSTTQQAAQNISSQLSSLQNTVTKGEQSGIDAATMNNQIKATVADMLQVASSATFSGVNLLTAPSGPGTSGSLSLVQDVSGSTLTLGNQNVATALSGLNGLTVGSAGVKVGLSTASAGVSDGDSITLSDGKNAWTFQIEPAGTAASAPPAPPGTGGNSQLFTVSYAAGASDSQKIGALINSMQSQGFTATLNNSGDLEVYGNGISAGATGAAVTLEGVSSQTATTSTAATVISTVQTAIGNMNTISATVGAKAQQVTAMQTFTSALSDALTSGLGALTDADMAAESAKLQSLQTKQQLAVQSLSIANQQPQIILKLFG